MLTGFVQLAQTGQLPPRSQIRCWTLITVRFLLIQHAAAQAGSDANHAIQPVVSYEASPLFADIKLILRSDDVGRSAMHAVLIEEQPDDIMSARQRCFRKAQCTACGRGVGR